MKACRVSLPILTLLAFAIAGRAHADIQIDGDRMTVTTEHLIAYFRGADLMRLTNRLTQEQYLHTVGRFDPLLDVKMLVRPGTPLQTTGWRRGNSINANPDAAMTTFNDLMRTIYISVVVEPQTQDIVVTLWAEANREQNVKGVTWGLRGLDLSAGRLVIPAEGGCYADRNNLPESASFEYPSHWEAGMALWVTKRGGFVIYTRDEDSRYKKLHVIRRGDYADVALETEAVAPWRKAGGAPQMEWRINAFKGDWRVPAAGYRSLMAYLRKPLELRGERTWVRDVRAVARIEGDKFDLSMLDALSKQIEPQKTLLYLTDWRQGGRDGNYPDYSPKEKVRPFVEKAHELGFRVMLHASLVGVSPGSEDFARVRRYQMKDAESLAPLGNRWDQPESDPARFAYINPASKVYRDLFITRFGAAIDELHPDAIHLETSSRMVNDGNGLVEDKNAAQGAVALHRALLAAYPSLVIGGDGMNELISPYCSFAQRRPSGTLPPHPISAYLFGDHIHSYAGFALPNPDRAPNEYRKVSAQCAAIGTLPTLVLSDASDLAADKTGIHSLLKVARAWEQHGLLPDWRADWSTALFRYLGADEERVVVESTPAGFCIKDGDKILYQTDPPPASAEAAKAGMK